MGIGIGEGEDRAEEAAKGAISSPLLESSIEGAKGVLLSIAGPTDLTLHEVNRAADLITRVAHSEANIIFGAVVDDALGQEVRVTVIAAGFDKLPQISEGRITRLLEVEPEEPLIPAVEDPAVALTALEEDEEEVIFRPASAESALFSDEEDLDIPDFLKS
jgi:cell division protein FtsZ